MRILKTIGALLFFVVLGVGIGVGAFYIQQYFGGSSASQAAAATSTPAASSSLSVHLGSTAYSFALPANTVLVEAPATGYGTGIVADSYTLSKISKGIATDSGIALTYFTVNSQSESILSTAKAKFIRTLQASGQPTTIKSVQNKAAVTLKVTEYETKDLTTVQCYEVSSSSSFLSLCHTPLASGGFSTTDWDALKESILPVSQTTPTTSPDSNTSSSILNLTNPAL
jgi:hypothetical protein